MTKKTKKKQEPKEKPCNYLIVDTAEGGSEPRIIKGTKEMLVRELSQIYLDDFENNGDDIKMFNKDIEVYALVKKVNIKASMYLDIVIK